jgi:hypothetical protein
MEQLWSLIKNELGKRDDEDIDFESEGDVFRENNTFSNEKSGNESEKNTDDEPEDEHNALFGIWLNSYLSEASWIPPKTERKSLFATAAKAISFPPREAAG